MYNEAFCYMLIAALVLISIIILRGIFYRLKIRRIRQEQMRVSGASNIKSVNIGAQFYSSKFDCYLYVSNTGRDKNGEKYVRYMVKNKGGLWGPELISDEKSFIKCYTTDVDWTLN